MKIPNPSSNLAMLEPCWHYVGTFFALWRFFSFLRTSYALLARFPVVLGAFCASWDAPNSILEGPGRLWGRFSRPRGLIFPGFFVHASLQPLALNQTCACVKNHSFSYVFPRFLTYASVARMLEKQRKIVSRAFHAQLPTNIVQKIRSGARQARF